MIPLQMYANPSTLTKAFPVTVTLAEAGNTALTMQLLKYLRSF